MDILSGVLADLLFNILVHVIVVLMFLVQFKGLQHLLCQQFLTWFMHAILRLFCAHDIVLSHFCPSLSLSPSLNFLALSDRFQGLGGVGGGRAGLWCAPQTYKPVFRVSNLHLQLWHYPSNCTLLKAPYKYSNITRTKMSHKIFKSSQFGFKLKVLLTYLAVDLCQQRNGRQCQKSFQKLTQSSVKLRLVSIVEKKMEVRVSTVQLHIIYCFCFYMKVVLRQLTHYCYVL